MEVLQINGSWITKEELELRKEFMQEREKVLDQILWENYKAPIISEKEKYKDSLKWALVRINDKREMLFVSNIDMKAYKTHGYNIILPLEELKYSKFERWCTSFDL